MKSVLTMIKTEPALITGAIQAVLALVVGTGVNLSAGQTGALLAVTTAVLALVTAASARPFQVGALTGLVSAVVTLLIAFGVHGVQPGIVSSLNAAIVAVMALVLRGHVTPVATLRAQAQAKPAPAPVTPARP
jgi:hypothetical protein